MNTYIINHQTACQKVGSDPNESNSAISWLLSSFSFLFFVGEWGSEVHKPKILSL
jgi:hypothetical protein